MDSITIKEGNDAQVASRQILEGSRACSRATSSSRARSWRARRRGDQKDQLVLTPPTGRFRYIALNNTVKPFDDPNVRKALSAAFDRDALRKAFGGAAVGNIPTHWIPPGQPGFEEAGGDAGPGVDFLAKPEGDMDAGEGVHEEGRLRVGQVRRRQDVHRRLGQRDAAEAGRRDRRCSSSPSSASRST